MCHREDVQALNCLVRVKEDMPQSGSKSFRPSPCLNGATCWHGPTHKHGCLWRRRVAENCSGLWESILAEKTSWHLLSKQRSPSFMLRVNEDLWVFRWFSVAWRRWWRLTSLIVCSPFMWFLLSETPNLTLSLCHSVSWGWAGCASHSVAAQHDSLTGYGK